MAIFIVAPPALYFGTMLVATVERGLRIGWARMVDGVRTTIFLVDLVKRCRRILVLLLQAVVRFVQFARGQALWPIGQQ